MRKMKKINGYLVVKFNDREKREYEGTALGEYGVIDAELYTGNLDIDRGAMEYDNAGTIEEAVELARGLESELEVDEPERKITVAVETDNSFTEEEVDPEVLFRQEKTALGNQIASKRYPDTDHRTAVHSLYGYVRALKHLGIVDEFDERFDVTPDTFGGYEVLTPLPREPEELLAYFCDEKCKERIPGRTQEELDAACEKCAVERLAALADDRDLRVRGTSHGKLAALIGELRGTQLNTKAERLEAESRAYLRALVDARVVAEHERIAFEGAIQDAVAARPYTAERATFENLHPGIKRDPTTARVYALGLALAQDCPENDCKLYLNIFNMARELDATLDELDGDSTPALVLRRELRERASELAEMYRENYAVQKYKEAMQP